MKCLLHLKKCARHPRYTVSKIDTAEGFREGDKIQLTQGLVCPFKGLGFYSKCSRNMSRKIRRRDEDII